MNLSTLIGSGANPYLEYGWVCAPNTAGQSITANILTTLTIDTEVADTGNFGSIASNQITLAAGTYYFEYNFPLFSNGAGRSSGMSGLYNVTDSTWITRSAFSGVEQLYTNAATRGQFTISAQKTIRLDMWVSYLYTSTGSVQNGTGGAQPPSIATAGADQRTTIKLWKLA